MLTNDEKISKRSESELGANTKVIKAASKTSAENNTPKGRSSKITNSASASERTMNDDLDEDDTGLPWAFLRDAREPASPDLTSAEAHRAAGAQADNTAARSSVGWKAAR